MNADQGAVLVRLARATIEASLGLPGAPPADAGWLDEPGATFVTLTKSGNLRGCIGTLEARAPLGEDLRKNALAAAFQDPRFPPVTRPELPALRVEVSLLSSLSPVDFTTEAEALAALRPHLDGIVLEAGFHRATFLPQVWEQIPEPRQFLAHLKAKAGLLPDHWGPEIRLFRYGVEKWKEER